MEVEADIANELLKSNSSASRPCGAFLFFKHYIMYTVEELQETVEHLEEMVNRHEEALAFIVSALKDEPSLSQEAKDDIIDAYYEFYPEYLPKKKK